MWLGNSARVDPGSGQEMSSGRVPAAKESGQFAAEEKASSLKAQGSRWRISKTELFDRPSKRDSRLRTVGSLTIRKIWQSGFVWSEEKSPEWRIRSGEGYLVTILSGWGKNVQCTVQ